MLKHLNIKNFLIIKDLTINFSQKLNVITGESGAGKSLIIEAVKLLMGKKFDSKKNLDEKCIIEGTFASNNKILKNLFMEKDLDYDDSILIRREINIFGKSRSFINDTPVSLNTLKFLCPHLIDIHSQFDNNLMKDKNFQLQILDLCLNADLVKDYKTEYRKYNNLNDDFKKKFSHSKEILKEYDYNLFLLTELEKYDLTKINQQKLESEISIYENSEFLKQKLYEITSELNFENSHLYDALYNILKNFENISKFSQEYDTLKKRFQALIIEIKDIFYESNSNMEQVDFDPEKLETNKNILNHIYSLQKKHNLNNVKGLVDLQQSLLQKNEYIGNLEYDLKNIENQLQTQKIKIKSLASEISTKRKNIINMIENKLLSFLSDLDIPNSELKINLYDKELDETGKDNIEILFNANKGQNLNSIQHAASGGEISRLMFVFKLILLKKIKMPTIIFDEVDSGLSGEAAKKLAQMLKNIADDNQLIIVTHLPQVAASGDTHLYIYKNIINKKTESKLKILNKDEKPKYIAQMIAGKNITEYSLKNAKELIDSI